MNLKSIGTLVKIILAGVIMWFLYTNVLDQETSRFSDLMQTLATKSGAIWIISILLLMFLNLSMESIKWRLLIEKIEPVSFGTAFQAVCTGMSVSIFTPNRIGEFMGRIFFIERGDRIEATISTIIGNTAQLITTICIGGLALIAFSLEFPGSIDIELLFYPLILIISLLITVLVLAFINTHVLTAILNKLPFTSKYLKYTEVFSKYTSRELSIVLALSGFRFSLFTLQFYLLLNLFKVNISPVEGMILIPLIFLTKTAIPSFSLAELGIRELVSLFFIGYVSNNETGIIAAGFSIWLINLAVPASLGLLFLFNVRVFKIGIKHI